VKKRFRPSIDFVHGTVGGIRRLLYFLRRQRHRSLRRNLRQCKGSGWIELFGAGMVDPAVTAFVTTTRRKLADRLRHGMDRLAMLKYGIDDIQRFLSE